MKKVLLSFVGNQDPISEKTKEFGAVIMALSKYLSGKEEFAEALDGSLAKMASTLALLHL